MARKTITFRGAQPSATGVRALLTPYAIAGVLTQSATATDAVFLDEQPHVLVGCYVDVFLTATQRAAAIANVQAVEENLSALHVEFSTPSGRVVDVVPLTALVGGGGVLTGNAGANTSFAVRPQNPTMPSIRVGKRQALQVSLVSDGSIAYAAAGACSVAIRCVFAPT